MGNQKCRPTHERVGVFTVDVEDWFHPLEMDSQIWPLLEDRVVSSTLNLLSLLAESRNRATFFVLGWVAERHPELVSRILLDGHEVGTHGYLHSSLKRLDRHSFRKDLRRSLSVLAEAGATEVTAFRAPYFSLSKHTEWSLDVLVEEGIHVDSSLFPLWTGSYGAWRTPNGPHRKGGVLEVPITLPAYLGHRVPLTGGFYCRLFPAAFLENGIRRVCRAAGTPVFYVHPWELDPAHPRYKGPFLRTIRHYHRLDATESLIRRLLSTFRWQTLGAALSNWSERTTLND